MTVGEIIRKKRKEKGLTQKELADLVYSTPVAISQFENDKHLPKIDMMYSIAEILSVPVEEFLFSNSKISKEPEKLAESIEACQDELCKITGYNACTFEFTPVTFNFYRSLKVWNPSYTFENCLKDFVIPYVKKNQSEQSRFFLAYGKKESEEINMERNKGFLQLGKNTKKVLEHNAGDNVLVIGSTGSSKTRSFVKPNILNVEGNILCVDVNGEIYRDTKDALKEKGYDVVLISINNREDKAKYNPLINVNEHNTEAFLKFLGNEHENIDQFWKSAMNTVARIVFKEMNALPKCEQNMDFVNKRLNTISQNEYDEFKLIPEKCFKNVIVNLQVALNILNIPEINVKENDIDVDKLPFNERPTAVFLDIFIGDRTFDGIFKFFIQSLFDAYYKASGKIVNPLFVFFDEYANFQWNEFSNVLAIGRAYNIHCYLIIQSVSQLSDKSRDTILANCDTILFLGSPDVKTHEYISKRCGYKTISSKGKGFGLFNLKKAATQTVPFFTTEELSYLPADQCVILQQGEVPTLDYKL